MANIKDKEPRDENGKPHGEFVRYHENGKLMYRSNYVHGRLHGFSEWYYNTGTLFHRGHLNMGRREGHWVYYEKKHYYYLCLI